MRNSSRRRRWPPSAARLGAEPGDVLLLVASDENKVVWDSLGALRCNLAARFGLIDEEQALPALDHGLPHV